MGSMDIYAESAVGNADELPYGDDTFQVVDEAAGGVIAYCHADSAERIVAALIAAGPQPAKASTLAELIGVLSICDPAAKVLLDYRGQLTRFGKPTYYRSYHDELALTPDGAGDRSVAEVIEILREVRVSGFTRPGVSTRTTDSTNVWVANYREASGLRVNGVREDGGTVVITTEDQGF